MWARHAYRLFRAAREASIRIRPTTLIVRNSKIALFRCCKQCSRICGVLGGDQDLDLTEPIEGEAVGLAQRFAASRGGNTVSVQKRAYLCLFRLALRGVDDDPFVFHLKKVTHRRVDSLHARCYAPIPLF